MKKVLFAFLVLIIFSCTKQSKTEEVTPTRNNLPSLPSSFIASDHFKNLVNTTALGLLNLSTNSSFRSYVNSKIDLQFDNEDDVLLKTIDFHPSSGLTLAQEMLNSVTAYGSTSSHLALSVDNYNFGYYEQIDTIGHCINGFEDISNSKYFKGYFHIYIPFKDLVNTNSIPTIVVGIGDEDYARGYKFDSQGNLQVISVDENYAKSNLVWVVAVNERVDENGVYYGSNVISTLHDNDNDIHERAGETYFLTVDSIDVDQYKESWLNGGPEVSMLIIKKLLTNPCIPFETDRQYQTSPLVCLTKKQTDLRKYFKANGVTLLTNTTAGPFTPTFNVHGWILFEDDWMYNSKASIPSCPTLKFDFDSKDSPYGVEDYFGFNGIASVPIGFWLPFWFPGNSFDYPVSQSVKSSIKILFRRTS